MLSRVVLTTLLVPQGMAYADGDPELKDPVRDKIERYGLTRTIDPRHFFPTLESAVTAFRQETGAEWTTADQDTDHLTGRTRLTRCAALLGRSADPGGEQVTEADHTVHAPPLHDGQVTEAVQEHDLGRVLDRRVRAR